MRARELRAAFAQLFRKDGQADVIDVWVCPECGDQMAYDAVRGQWKHITNVGGFCTRDRTLAPEKRAAVLLPPGPFLDRAGTLSSEPGAEGPLIQGRLSAVEGRGATDG